MMALLQFFNIIRGILSMPCILVYNLKHCAQYNILSVLYYFYVICADDQTEFSEEEYRRYRDNKVLEIRKAVPSTVVFSGFKGRASRKRELNYCQYLSWTHCTDTISKIRNIYSQKKNCAASVLTSTFMCL
jgi:hypothetical protein